MAAACLTRWLMMSSKQSKLQTTASTGACGFSTGRQVKARPQSSKGKSRPWGGSRDRQKSLRQRAWAESHQARGLLQSVFSCDFLNYMIMVKNEQMQIRKKKNNPSGIITIALILRLRPFVYLTCRLFFFFYKNEKDGDNRTSHTHKSTSQTGERLGTISMSISWL